MTSKGIAHKAMALAEAFQQILFLEAALRVTAQKKTCLLWSEILITRQTSGFYVMS